MSSLISFDYAIKYLLKDKSDYEIVEGFISALLSLQGYKPIKIKSLLESESNREAMSLKRSVADVIVEDEQGNNYIVEIDRSYTNLFLYKACFNSSRLIVDNIGAKQDYLKIKKVFHINILYFPFENIKTPLHHGKVIFHEIDKEHPVNIHLIDRGMHNFDFHNIFPEYFVISVPLFNDVIRQEIDEWLYMMKHSDVKEDFKSPYMEKIKERLNVLKMTNEERENYDKYIMESLKNRDYIISAEEKGKAEGIEQGIEQGIELGKAEGIEIGEARGKLEGKLEVARNLLKLGLPIDTIATASGLSIAEIKLLQNNSK